MLKKQLQLLIKYLDNTILGTFFKDRYYRLVYLTDVSVDEKRGHTKDNPDLIPTIIIDILGRISTRYKRIFEEPATENILRLFDLREEIIPKLVSLRSSFREYIDNLQKEFRNIIKDASTHKDPYEYINKQKEKVFEKYSIKQIQPIDIYEYHYKDRTYWISDSSILKDRTYLLYNEIMHYDKSDKVIQRKANFRIDYFDNQIQEIVRILEKYYVANRYAPEVDDLQNRIRYYFLNLSDDFLIKEYDRSKNNPFPVDLSSNITIPTIFKVIDSINTSISRKEIFKRNIEGLEKIDPTILKIMGIFYDQGILHFRSAFPLHASLASYYIDERVIAITPDFIFTPQQLLKSFVHELVHMYNNIIDINDRFKIDTVVLSTVSEQLDSTSFIETSKIDKMIKENSDILQQQRHILEQEIIDSIIKSLFRNKDRIFINDVKQLESNFNIDNIKYIMKNSALPKEFIEQNKNNILSFVFDLADEIVTENIVLEYLRSKIDEPGIQLAQVYDYKTYPKMEYSINILYTIKDILNGIKKGDINYILGILHFM